MYYIAPAPNETGNYGNPMGQPFPASVALPDDLLPDYLAARGFCNVTVEDGTVTALTADQEALDAYLAEFPDVEPEKPVTVEDLQAENKLLKEQVSALSTQADFHEECLVEMANIVYA